MGIDGMLPRPSSSALIALVELTVDDRRQERRSCRRVPASIGTCQVTSTPDGAPGRVRTRDVPARSRRGGSIDPQRASTASWAATSASWSMRAVLARTEAPAVISAMRASSQGVRAGPSMPAASASAMAARPRPGRRRRGVPRPPAPARTPGRRSPGPGPDASRRSAAAAARSAGDQRRADPRRPREEARQLVLPDGDDRHAVRLEVLERGRHVEDRLGTGAHDGHRRSGPSSWRSDEMSNDGGATADPQRPPMHAADAARREHPDPGRVTRRSSWPTRSSPPSHPRPGPPPATAGRPCARTRPARSPGPRGRPPPGPTSSRPSRTATVAGTAPPVRTAASDAGATSRFCGYGRPWLMSVDSRATTGVPSARAAATSGRPTSRSVTVCGMGMPEA